MWYRATQDAASRAMRRAAYSSNCLVPIEIREKPMPLMFGTPCSPAPVLTRMSRLPSGLLAFADDIQFALTYASNPSCITASVAHATIDCPTMRNSSLSSRYAAPVLLRNPTRNGYAGPDRSSPLAKPALRKNPGRRGSSGGRPAPPALTPASLLR